MATSSKKIMMYTGIILALLALPLIGMQFSNAIDWKAGDFVMAAVLLVLATLVIETTNRIIPNKTLRRVLMAVGILVIVLIWLELAVGVFNSPIAGS
jgi:asparagine N-glycosylation enzyme membrane subunit Stt3